MAKMNCLIWLVDLCVLLVFVNYSSAKKSATEGPSTLIKSLLADSNVNRILRPMAGGNATTVQFGISLQDIVYKKGDDEDAIICFVTWVNMNWNDPRLKWDSQIYNIDSIRFPSNKLWIPDIQLYNSLDPTPELQWSSDAVVTDDGSVLLVSPNHLPVHCQNLYPKNLQNGLFSVKAPEWSCRFKFGSWTYDGRAVDLKLQHSEADISSFLDFQYKITNNHAQRNVVKYECCPEEYIDIEYNITLTGA